MAFPVYAMSCFKLPKTTISNLTSAMADFWWHTVEHKRKIHWMRWDKLCLPRELGGLGFKNLQCFNQALLAKQCWRILQSPNSLLARLLKSRYFDSSSFLEAKMGSRPSYGWRSLMFGRDLLMTGLRKELGNGKSLNVWTDPWCDFGGRRNPWMKNLIIDLELKVSDLIDQETGAWKKALLEENFFPADVAIILRKTPVVAVDDFWCWKHTKSGAYTVRSGNWLAVQDLLSEEFQEARMQPSINGLKEAAWNALTTPKIKTFMWRAISSILPVANELQHRGMKVDPVCQHCGIYLETPNHVLFTCDVARQVWALSNFPSPMNGFHADSIFVNFHYLFQMSKNIRIPKEIWKGYPWILWFLWKNRNKFLFEGSEFRAEDIVGKAYDEAAVWEEAQKLDQEGDKRETQPARPQVKSWSKPERFWLKCNYGYSWSQQSKRLGAAWIVRNYKGDSLLHSRRTFVNVSDLQEVQRLVLYWSLELMVSHGIGKVIFAGEDATLLKALQRPRAWPSFLSMYHSVKPLLDSFRGWKCVIESRSSNRSAFAIAKSAHQPQWGQSYVSGGAPDWLGNLLLADKG
ncbi:uncharacterized protein LOC108836684 [Raphanus sativus]|uniref:Uncharacterized protein LOC108836684 n=1 Tax=Raphanus sativus TaxID=3726 RepID=A0A6J0LZV2_RAPSA|nr:uncharacterized protein LOC108836684 [Raphanus sativus]